MRQPCDDPEEPCEEPETESFAALVKFTLSGFVGGLTVAAILDCLGFQRSPIGQWIVRTLAGEGESIFEGIFSIHRRVFGATGSLAEAYGWGKLLGMIFPWIIDWGSRLSGVNVSGVEGFYIPYFYAMSDQIGGNLLGLVFMRRQRHNWASTLRRYFHHPVMMASLTVILWVPLGLLAARLVGFSPTTQVYTALETMAANLCWVPPVVGWYVEKFRSRKGGCARRP